MKLLISTSYPDDFRTVLKFTKVSEDNLKSEAGVDDSFTVDEEKDKDYDEEEGAVHSEDSDPTNQEVKIGPKEVFDLGYNTTKHVMAEKSKGGEVDGSN